MSPKEMDKSQARKFEIKFLLVLVDTFDVDVSVRINPVDDSLQTDAL